MWLVAPAGRGKSALLARWLQQLDTQRTAVAFVPVSIGYNTALGSVVFAALAGEIFRAIRDVCRWWP